MTAMHTTISEAHVAAVKKSEKPINNAHFKKLLDKNVEPGNASPTSKESEACAKWARDTMPRMEETVKKAGCNPFNIDAQDVLLDLLTDSGTSRLAASQKRLKKAWEAAVPDHQNFAYAGLPARASLDAVVADIFGAQFYFQPTLQGRSSEFLLLKSMVDAGAIGKGDVILSNRPFDTTKGHINNVLIEVVACTKLTTPDVYANSADVFLGNMPFDTMKAEHGKAQGKAKAVLMTLTDNGGGGQPVSMENVRKAAEFANENGLLVWIDACRIFENAFYIKLFEKGYELKTLPEIVREILSYADVATLSFKKMYSHTGGAVFLNRESAKIAPRIEAMKTSMQETSTVLYGMSYPKGYCGLNGDKMVEIISGIHLAIDPEVIGSRIAQVKKSGAVMAKYGAPVVPGAHADYLAADRWLPNVPLEKEPAEYLQAILLASLGIRGCGLGNRLYGKWEETKGAYKLKVPAEMDSMRLAIPRLAYSDAFLSQTLEIAARAYAEGVFSKASGGLSPANYNDRGFYHFGGCHQIRNEAEFSGMVQEVREIARA
ncbi:Tryptophanase [uncultured archaeon]|nr:Tryptophanase [uncultured archaeon]